MRLEIGSTATPAACVRHFRDTPGVTSAPERPAYNREVNGLTLATTRSPIHQQASDRSSPRARTTSNGAMYTMSDITKFSPLFLFAGLVLAAPAAALAKGGDTQKAETPMTRPAGAPDTNAAGKIRVEHDTGDNRDKLKVEAQYIDTSLTFEAWVADGGGTLTFIANMPYNGPGEVEVEFDTDEGLPLPFSAGTVESLAGRTLEVRSGGQTYLTGVIPSVSGGSGGGGGGSGSGGSNSSSKWEIGKAPLMRPSPAPDSDASGYVETRKRAKDNHQKFKVEAEHLDPAGSFAVFVEDAVGSGVFANVGAMGPESKIGEFELELETEDGDALPFGVTDVADLAGRGVQVRDASDVVLLEGVVPGVSFSLKATKAQTSLTAVIAGKGKLRLRNVPKKAQQFFELQLKKVGKGAVVEVFVFDPNTSSMALVQTLNANGGGNTKLKINTRKGQSLPLNALTLSELGGRAIEVRLQGAGTVLLTGVIPTL
jgi:hypothetical protein